MNVTPPRNIFLLVCAAILIGAGLYLATGQRSENRSESQPAAKTEATAPTEASAGDSAVAVPDKADTTGQNPRRAPDRENRPNVFGLNGAVQLQQVPEGRFRNELSRLSETARRYAMDKLGRLQVPLNDVESLSVEANGQLFYQCTPPRLPPPPALVALAEHNEASAGLPGAPEKSEAAAEVPISAAPIRHSRPGATKVIYLDFNGHTISGTAWNQERGSVGDANYRPAVASYVAKPFNTEGNPQTFSDAEQSLIIKVWERVAEDYRGFDVDVTTQEPASFTANTGRILVTDNVDANGVLMPSSSGSGVAYLDVFGEFNYASNYSPALVYANQNYNYASYIAETASHEMGHNLSLSHDGTTTGDEYYNGHGTGDTSWNTIMGGAFSENVTQWSKGEYFDSNNPEDDLAEIAARLSYVPDDHADSNGSAAPLAVSGLTVSGSGVISQTGEADRFSFESGAGAITLSATTFRSSSQSHGGNLDVVLELYDTGGSLVASANVDGITDATLNATVSGGTYFLRVFGAGSGTPLTDSPSGYTNYGSLGQYTISGTVVSTTPVAPSITSQPADQAVYEGQSAQFSVSANGYPAPTYQWQRLPTGSGAWVDLGNTGVYSGATTVTLSISVTNAAMSGDRFRCVATNVSNSTTSNPATITVTATSLPVFTSHPTSQSIEEGGSVTFSAVATGVPSPTFQWRKDGVNISGATSSSYTIQKVTVENAGTYTVVGSNLAGSVISNVAILAVVAPPVITPLGSARQVLSPGQPLALSVSVSSVPAVNYQWTHNGRVIAGATGSNYAVSSFSFSDSGWYQVIVRNSAGSTRSAARFVMGLPNSTLVSPRQLISWGVNHDNPPAVTDGVLIASGNNHSLVLRANGTVLGWGDNSLGQITIPSGLNNVVALAVGTAHSLAVKSDGTVVGWGRNDYGQTNIPVGLTDVVAVAAGDTHSLALRSDGTVVGWGFNASGQIAIPAGLTGVVSLATYFNHTKLIKGDGTVVRLDTMYGSNLPSNLTDVIAVAIGGTGSSGNAVALKGDGTVAALSSVPAELADVVSVAAGDAYALAVKGDGTVAGWGDLSFAIGSPVTSLTNVLSLSAGGKFYVALREGNDFVAPVITSQPVGQTVSIGATTTFMAAASGVPGPYYQWRKNGVELPGANGSTYTIANVSAGDAGLYDVVVTNYMGRATSNAALLAVRVKPIFTAQPVSQVVPAGIAVTFTAAADSLPAPSFQWRKDGVNITGATGSSYTIFSPVAGDAGTYTAVAVNSVGLTVSNPATLTVSPVNSPYFANPPGSAAVTMGQSVAFACMAIGIPAPTYQWQKNGLDIIGATTNIFKMGGVVASDAGSYTVVATNSVGSIISEPVALAVNVPQYIFSTFPNAGTLSNPRAVALDGSGNVYVIDGSMIKKITPAGVQTAFAGAADSSGTTDGVGSAARFNNPNGLAVDGAGNVYVTDGTGTIRRITPDRVVTTVAGSAGNFGSADGVGSAARFYGPTGLAVDKEGNVYVVDGGNYTIRKITPGGSVTTLAGTAGNLGSADGAGGAASFSYPTGIAVDSMGSVYVADRNNFTIRKISPGGIVTTLAGNKGNGGSDDGLGGAASFLYPDGIAVDASSNVYVTDYHGRIRKITPLGVVSTLAGANGTLYFNNPAGIAVDAGGNIYISEYYTRLIRWGMQVPPALTSVATAHGTIGRNFTYAIVFSGGQNSYSASGLPDGLAVDSATGVISGIPVESGVFSVMLHAITAAGSTPAVLTLTISSVGPIFTTQPESQTVIDGATVTFAVTVSGAATPTFQWRKNGANIDGATSNSYVIAGVAATDVGDYTVIATNELGTVTSNVATLALGTIPAGFDVQGYLARYPDVASVYGANPYAAWRHYHDVGIYQGEVFDELFRVDEYLALYPELFAIFGTDLGGVLDHWLSTGRIEGKLGRIPLEFSATGYFARNTDVATAVNNNPILAWGHYWAYGIYEGRAYDDELRVFEYLAINADLTAAFVNDWRQAALHWMRYGRTEGRLGRLPLTFSVATYLSRNPDVAAVWGTDPTTVFLHFWLYGINEARTYDDLFRVDDYLALNPDLAATFGTDRRGAFKHWVRYGQSEGRPGRNP